MALTDEEQAKKEAELEATKKQLADLLAKAKTDEETAKAAKEAEGKRSKEKPGKVELDPDVVKEVADLKAKVAKLEAKLGSGTALGGGMRLNFFRED